MRRFTPIQLLLLAFGFGLILTAIFLPQPPEKVEEHRKSNAVEWQGMRLVPREDQRINTLDPGTLVVHSLGEPGARLTFFLRTDDGLTPQAIVRELCRRDTCSKTSASGNRAVASYRINGESMQIVLMHLSESEVWVEYKGPPETLADFDQLISSVTTQLASRRTNQPG